MAIICGRAFKVISVIVCLSAVCASGRYGAGCRRQCHCESSDTCDVITGQCPAGCADSWVGPSCQTGQYLILIICQCHLKSSNESCCIYSSLQVQQESAAKVPKDYVNHQLLFHC